jgi:para-nitrobenzyl esterase
VFDSIAAVPDSWTEQDRAIAKTMSSYWANFITRGDPNGPALAHWDKHSATPQVMELGDRFAPRPLTDPVRQAFFEKYFAGQNSW